MIMGSNETSVDWRPSFPAVCGFKEAVIDRVAADCEKQHGVSGDKIHGAGLRQTAQALILRAVPANARIR